MTRKSSTTSDNPAADPADPVSGSEFDIGKIAVQAPPSINDAADNPFANLDNIRVDQTHIAQMQTKKVLNRIPLLQPRYPQYFRIRPGPEYRVDTLLIEGKGLEAAGSSDQWFFVTVEMRPKLYEHLKTFRLFQGVTRRGTPFIYPAKLGDPENTTSTQWADSRLAGLELCMTGWYALKSNSEINGFEPKPAAGTLPEPVFPDKPFSELLALAFKDLTIRNEQHLIYRELYGLP